MAKQRPKPPCKVQPMQMDGRQWCVQCRQWRDPDEFRDELDDYCHACRQSNSMSQLSEKNRKALATLANRIADAAGDVQSIEAPHISEFWAGVSERAGGMREMSKLVWDEIKLRLQSDPGNPKNMNAINALIKLAQQSTTHRHTAPDMASMDTKDIGEAIAQRMSALALSLNSHEIEPLIPKQLEAAAIDETGAGI